MLNKETLDNLKIKIKEINKLKTVDQRLATMIQIKDNLRNEINDELDDLFAGVNLYKTKLNLEEED